MQKTLLFVDKVSTWVGHAFSWFIVGLTLLVTWEVFSRYALDDPHAWAFDAMAMLYGTMFMMAGAYTLAKNGHVRGDVLYGFFRPRTQATIDLVLFIVFFIPGVIALTYAGYYYAADSWRIDEHSSVVAEGPPEALAEARRKHAPRAARIGLEAGQLASWLYHGLTERGLPARRRTSAGPRQCWRGSVSWLLPKMVFRCAWQFAEGSSSVDSR
jgi:TRAP-type mannitol/chloroaromatic compound transport system permease small subunit